jgi:hypothetical protein
MNVAPSSIPLAPQHPGEEDEDSNNDPGLGIEDDEETESDVVLPRPAAKQRSKNNNDRDAARDGTTREPSAPYLRIRGRVVARLLLLVRVMGR